MMSLLASHSSVPSLNYKFNVFSSFHGPDVRKTLLSHMREQFSRNGITMFDDQEIERSAIIAPALTEAIKDSRISIVILSKRYASSSWCLDELVEIMETKKAMGHIVMTIFYGVEPSDVRNQTGEFGITFSETCARKTNEKRQKWSTSLYHVGTIAGEDFLTWNSEAAMIKKIAKDVLEKLNATPSRDFDGMVGLEDHLREMESLLDLGYDGVKMVAITGPAGIGKTTIARALQSLLSDKFQLTCFVDNLREKYHSGLDDYGLQLRYQEQLISKVLNQNGIRISHLGAVKQNLGDQRVLIILDDVNNIKQLEALAKDTTWFGPGSRIVVTTENKEILQQHGIKNSYSVDFPSDEEALKILCLYAFPQSSIYHGFEGLATRVTALCGNLPLGLRVVGSFLREKNREEWEEVICRLETTLDHQDIEEVLRVGYESLHENEQSLFLHIAVFFNCEDGDLVKAMFADNNLNVRQGLKTLVNRSLIHISTDGEIVMHKLLQQVSRQAIQRQEPWKRKILIDAQEICDVLEDDKGTRIVSGISFDISGIDEVYIGKKAFKRMPNLRFLKVYKRRYDDNDRMHIPEEMEFLSRLKLLQWEAYPNKCLPPRFQPEYLVKLDMKNSQLKYLWQGTQQLKNLKEIDLSWSCQLKELPDLTNATNLERLDLVFCKRLHGRMRTIEKHSSYANAHQGPTYIKDSDCIKDLHSLKNLYASGCKRLALLPELPGSLSGLYANDCASLKTVFSPLNTSSARLCFTNCFELDQQTRRAIIQRSFRYGNNTRLPGREVPAKFVHRARGNSLTIRLDASIVSEHSQRPLRPVYEEFYGYLLSICRTEHLFIFKSGLQYFHRSNTSGEVVFEFSSKYQDLDILECGVQILSQEYFQKSNESENLEGDEHRYEEKGLQYGTTSLDLVCSEPTCD
ncbi:unnamed protein product [Microthlaspi erraticum]|uniref:ADP-ribosyl cyclase/cyclic ADP-ribose hydrolase n=1 Tax=Microthlaspi erraticum TaxID=1685480 RepID=A0A6D2IHF0_9BRAS|nr:unnamed protein product [Microthlaspi erraticum]